MLLFYNRFYQIFGKKSDTKSVLTYFYKTNLKKCGYYYEENYKKVIVLDIKQILIHFKLNNIVSLATLRNF